MVGLRAASSQLTTYGGEPSKSSNRQNDVELELTTASNHSTFSSSSSGGGSSSSSSSSSSLPGGVSTLKVMRGSSFRKATPPATPPLSVASSHGIGGECSCHSSRKRPTRKTLGGPISGCVGGVINDNNDCGGVDYRYGGSSPPPPRPTPPTPSQHGHRHARTCSCRYAESDSECDDDSIGGNGNKLGPPTGKTPAIKRPRRRRVRCCLGSRCLLVACLCLVVAWGSFKIAWYFQWQAWCVEGCYDAEAAKTGSQGPEQVHLAYGGVDAEGNPTGVTVVWTTAAGEAPPVVEYGLSRDELNLTAHGSSVRYLDTVHHRAPLEDLAPGTRFFYRCGNPSSPAAAAAATTGGGAGGGGGGGEGAPEGRPPTLDLSVGGAGGGLYSGPTLGSDGSVSSEIGSTSAEAAEATVGTVGVRGGGDSGGDGVVTAAVVTEGGKWSGVSSFVTAPEPERWEGDGPWDRPVSVAVVGDLGLVNGGATFDRLHRLVEDGEVDFVLHLGDIGYADDAFLERPWSFGYEDKWDAFMRRASHEFAAKVPYMVVPGNHEAECHSPACLSSPRRLNALSNFAAFNARFRMPSIESGADHGVSMWYSFNVGPVHFVVVDTETDFEGAGGDHLHWVGFEHGNGGFGDQAAWLEQDLAAAHQERDVRPWIVVAGHRPMYSTEKSDSEGLTSFGHSNRIRKAFEPIFEKNKVDMYLSGHVHAFERSLPVLDNVPYPNDVSGSGMNGGGDGVGASPQSLRTSSSSSRMVYESPVAPVHIVNGAGGCIEGFTKPEPVYPASFPPWRAVAMSMVPGVGILTFSSKAEMRSTFVTSDSPAEVLDELTIRHQRPPLR
ncbi:unnamed protein product [Ectocarpus sp. CCAP 1310/34]|nr:unnamed protein product [Ectocarpus sp. CCAP 1310/34]